MNKLPERAISKWEPSRFYFPLCRFVAAVVPHPADEPRPNTRVERTAQVNQSQSEAYGVSILIFVVGVLQLTGVALSARSLALRAMLIISAPVLVPLLGTLQVAVVRAVIGLLRLFGMMRRVPDSRLQPPGQLVVLTLTAIAAVGSSSALARTGGSLWLLFIAANAVTVMLLPLVHRDRRSAA